MCKIMLNNLCYFNFEFKINLMYSLVNGGDRTAKQKLQSVQANMLLQCTAYATASFTIS